MQRSVYLLALISLIGCGPMPQPTSSKNQSAASTLEETNVADSLSLFSKTDPTQAAVSILAQPLLSPATAEATLQVPTVYLDGLEKGPADFVQIARCAVGTKLTTTLGKDISQIANDDATRLDSLKWIWINKVWAQNNACVIIGGDDAQNSLNRFQDISAKTGEFFYVFNPCVQQDRSTKKDNCSYNLVVSDSINYVSTLSEDFLATAKELSQAEGELQAIYSQLNYYAHLISSQQTACEKNYASDQANQNAWKGVTSLAIAGGAAGLAGYLSGGPAAVSAFQTAMAVTTTFFKSLPPIAFACPLADQYTAKAKALAAGMDASLEKVLKLRTHLGELDSTYGRLDSKL